MTCQIILNTYLKMIDFSQLIDSNKVPQNESETQYRVESEIAPPSSNVASQGWKNLRLKVKTARAFSSELATRNNRRYGYNPRQFQSDSQQNEGDITGTKRINEEL